MASAGPKLPPRPKSGTGDVVNGGNMQNNLLESVARRASQLSKDPILNRLANDPASLSKAMEDPRLKLILDNNPSMRNMFRPEYIQQMLKKLQNGLPVADKDAELIIPRTEWTQQRMNLMQMQRHMQQMQIGHPNYAAEAMDFSLQPPLSSASPYHGPASTVDNTLYPSPVAASNNPTHASTSYEGSFTYSHSYEDIPISDLANSNLRWLAEAQLQPPLDPGKQGNKLDPRNYYEEVPPSDWRPSANEETFLDLYRRAYCTYADALFPPLYVLSTLLLSSTQIPFWWIIGMLMVAFFGGVYVFATFLAGIPSIALGFSRIPLAFGLSAQTLALFGYPCLIAPFWPGGPPLVWSVLVVGIFTITLSLHISLMTSNPGYVSLLPAADSESGTNGVLDLVCASCNVSRPLRAKHCGYCGRCVRRMDHHCPAIGKCVGERNHRFFQLFITACFISMIIWSAMSITFLHAVHEVQKSTPAAGHESFFSGAASVLGSLWWARNCSHRWLVLVLMAMIPSIFGTGYLVARGYFLIASNLTVNEYANRKRYRYLNHELAGYCNRFDRGPLSNCWQFWTSSQHDWMALYEAGDKEMILSNQTLLTSCSSTYCLRGIDVLRTSYERYEAERKAIAEEERFMRAIQRQAGNSTVLPVSTPPTPGPSRPCCSQHQH